MSWSHLMFSAFYQSKVMGFGVVLFKGAYVRNVCVIIAPIDHDGFYLRYLRFIQKHHTNNTRNHLKPAFKNWKIQTYSNGLFFFCNHPFSLPEAEHIIVYRPNSKRNEFPVSPFLISLSPRSLENDFLPWSWMSRAITSFLWLWCYFLSLAAVL